MKWLTWPDLKLPPINLWSLPWWYQSTDTGYHYDPQGPGDSYERFKDLYNNRKKDG